MYDLLILAPKPLFRGMVKDGFKEGFITPDIYQFMIEGMHIKDRLDVFRGWIKGCQGVIVHPDYPDALFYLGLAYEARCGKKIIWYSSSPCDFPVKAVEGMKEAIEFFSTDE